MESCNFKDGHFVPCDKLINWANTKKKDNDIIFNIKGGYSIYDLVYKKFNFTFCPFCSAKIIDLEKMKKCRNCGEYKSAKDIGYDGEIEVFCKRCYGLLASAFNWWVEGKRR